MNAIDWYRNRAEDHGLGAAFYVHQLLEKTEDPDPVLRNFNRVWNSEHAYQHAREAAHYAGLVLDEELADREAEEGQAAA